MKIEDYPALYRSADAESLRAQKTHFFLLKCNGIALVAAAIAGLFGSAAQVSAWLAATFFVASTVVSIIMLAKRYDVDWYKARALAESVKTTTWRYVTGAEPFPISENIRATDSAFTARLSEIMADNRQITGSLVEAASGEQITAEMKRLRSSALQERKLNYRENRIAEQQAWYAEKAATNRRSATKFFVGLIALQIFAVASSIGSALLPGWTVWPTDILALLASLVLGWTQAKRFSELSASYALAAHEIGLINSRVDDVDSDSGLSDFVTEAEAAFSREHTQWVAQRE